MIKQFTTSVIVFNQLNNNPRVLLIHHNKFNKWMVPGGHVEQPFESPPEAAIREVKEETGVEVSLFSFIHKCIKVNDAEWILPPEYLHEQIIPKRGYQESHIHMDFLYLGIHVSGALNVNKREAKQVKWVGIDELKKLNMFDGTRTLIDCVYKKIYDNNETIVYKTFVT